jgi:hypothetical protein
MAEREDNMDLSKIENEMELNLYCNLLPLAYKVYLEQSGGFVCGSKAEEIRDKMFIAIKTANIL